MEILDGTFNANGPSSAESCRREDFGDFKLSEPANLVFLDYLDLVSKSVCLDYLEVSSEPADLFPDYLKVFKGLLELADEFPDYLKV